jgi:replicative DNA helicase
LADSALHDLATNDIYWDKVVGIVSLGQRDVCSFAEAEGNPVVVQGVVVRYPSSELGRR